MSRNNKVKFFLRLLLGKYSANDYIRLGRYISGGDEQICQEKV